jgi:hypothetical protein
LRQTASARSIPGHRDGVRPSAWEPGCPSGRRRPRLHRVNFGRRSRATARLARSRRWRGSPRRTPTRARPEGQRLGREGDGEIS